MCMDELLLVATARRGAVVLPCLERNLTAPMERRQVLSAAEDGSAATGHTSRR